MIHQANCLALLKLTTKDWGQPIPTQIAKWVSEGIMLCSTEQLFQKAKVKLILVSEVAQTNSATMILHVAFIFCTLYDVPEQRHLHSQHNIFMYQH